MLTFKERDHGGSKIILLLMVVMLLLQNISTVDGKERGGLRKMVVDGDVGLGDGEDLGSFGRDRREDAKATDIVDVGDVTHNENGGDLVAAALAAAARDNSGSAEDNIRSFTLSEEGYEEDIALSSDETPALGGKHLRDASFDDVVWDSETDLLKLFSQGFELKKTNGKFNHDPILPARLRHVTSLIFNETKLAELRKENRFIAPLVPRDETINRETIAESGAHNFARTRSGRLNLSFELKKIFIFAATLEMQRHASSEVTRYYLMKETGRTLKVAELDTVSARRALSDSAKTDLSNISDLESAENFLKKYGIGWKNRIDYGYLHSFELSIDKDVRLDLSKVEAAFKGAVENIDVFDPIKSPSVEIMSSLENRGSKSCFSSDLSMEKMGTEDIPSVVAYDIEPMHVFAETEEIGELLRNAAKKMQDEAEKASKEEENIRKAKKATYKLTTNRFVGAFRQSSDVDLWQIGEDCAGNVENFHLHHVREWNSEFEIYKASVRRDGNTCKWGDKDTGLGQTSGFESDKKINFIFEVPEKSICN